MNCYQKINTALARHNVKSSRRWHYRVVIDHVIALIEEDYTITRKPPKTPEEAEGRELIDQMD